MRDYVSGIIRAFLATAVLVGTPSCKKTTNDSATAAADAQIAAAPEPVAVAEDAGPPAPLTPAERLEQHRKEMADAAQAGRFTEVCKGTPWVNATICNWAAARAAGNAVERPNGELFRAYFGKEHWKHAYGRIVSDADKDGDYEVSVGGYNHHCILDTIDTKYDTKGAFNLWVQEQPEPREVTLNSGNTQEWVVLEEAELAKTLMDLAHAGGVEATAMAKNAMTLIASYEPYTERKGDLPTLPDAPTAPAVAAASAAPSPRTSTVSVDSLPQVRTGTPAAPVASPPSGAPSGTPTCPAGSTWNGSQCAGNAATCPSGAHFVAGQGCVADVVAPVIGTVSFNPAAAAQALGAVNISGCRSAGGPRGAGHLVVTFSPDGSVSSAVVDQPPFAGTPVAGCIANLFRAARVQPFAGHSVRMGKSFVVN
jgi:hypothetical protein